MTKLEKNILTAIDAALTTRHGKKFVIGKYDDDNFSVSATEKSLRLHMENEVVVTLQDYVYSVIAVETFKSYITFKPQF